MNLIQMMDIIELAKSHDSAKAVEDVVADDTIQL